jgi:Acyl-CoA synthetases (AMP-forming)/AMP-acid ligases II
MLRLLAAEAARRFGSRAAFDTGEARLSFSDLDRLSDRVAAGLAHRGVRMGDLVALVLPDGPELPVCYLAAAKIGAVTAALACDQPRRAEAIERLDPAIVVTTAAHARLGAGRELVVLPGSGGQPVESLRPLLRAEPPPPPLPPDPLRPVAVVFTAGTTGSPKPVVFANRQLAAILATGVGTRWGAGEARLLSRPLPHMTFMTRLPVLLQTGRTSHIVPAWARAWATGLPADGDGDAGAGRGDAGAGPGGPGFDAARVWRLLERERIGVLQGTPAQLAALAAALGEPACGTAGPPGSLRMVLCSGAPAPARLVRMLRERFRVPVCNRYLCTEAGLGLGTGPEDPPRDAEETVGRPRPGVEVDVRDADGRRLTRAEMDRGEVGEVLLRSDAVMSGYFRDPAADARAFARDGFVRTGDRGFVDRDGRLHLVGRTTAGPAGDRPDRRQESAPKGRDRT